MCLSTPGKERNVHESFDLLGYSVALSDVMDLVLGRVGDTESREKTLDLCLSTLGKEINVFESFDLWGFFLSL